MSHQVGLLPPETLEEALSDLARHEAVGGWKNLAVHMNPSYADDPTEAGKWLHRALSASARDVLHDKHIDRAVELGREVGCHVVVRWKCEVLWKYENPKPLNGKSRRLALLEEAARNAARNVEIQRELDAEDAASQIRSVR